MYKPVNNDAKGILINLAFNCLDSKQGKIGQGFRLFKSSTRGLSLSQLKGLFASALRLHRYAEEQRAAIASQREELAKIIEQARALV